MWRGLNTAAYGEIERRCQTLVLVLEMKLSFENSEKNCDSYLLSWLLSLIF